MFGIRALCLRPSLPLSILPALFRLRALLFFRSVFPPLIRLTDANTRCICNTSLSSHDPRKVSGNKALEAENTLQRYFLHASRKLIFATCRSGITWQAFSNNSKVTWIGFQYVLQYAASSERIIVDLWNDKCVCIRCCIVALLFVLIYTPYLWRGRD